MRVWKAKYTLNKGDKKQQFKIKAQNETSTSQKLTNLQIVGDLSASATCRRQLLGCCDQLVNFCDVEVSICALILSTITYEPIPVNNNLEWRLAVPLYWLYLLYYV